MSFKRTLFTCVSLFTLVALLAACGPTPAQVETVITQVVKETVVVAGTSQLVEREVTTVVQETIEKVVTPTPLPARDVVIVGLSAPPDTLDPADHRNRQSETVIRNMFDGLVTRDSTSGVHLELAEALNWPDDTTLEVQLRQGVKFHDGVEMTADDVVFTFERIILENMIEYPEVHSSPRKGLISPLASIEKTGDYSVVMHFSDPWPVAMQMLVHQQIVPKHYLEEVGTEGFVAAPIGTGPFKFVSAKGLEEIVMERFDDYYGGAPELEPVGLACVRQAVFRVIPEASTRVAALLAGEVDSIQGVPAEMLDTLAQTPGLQVKTTPGTQPKWMEMNVNMAPFDDVRVRQAMNYAMDKGLLVEAIYGGRAVPLPGALSPFNNYSNQSLQPYAYDPDKALSLFAEAGWTDSDGDGKLDKDGQVLSFTIDTLEEWRSLAEAVAGMYRAIGVEANVRFWEYSVVRPMLLGGERMAYLDDWGDSAFDPVGHFEAKWHGFVADQPYGRGNFSGYNNERVNELIKMGEITGDVEERHALYDEAQQLVYDEAPAVFLILPEEAEAARADIANWSPASDSRINLHDVCIAP
ncbi:MAG TPA: ABC transporter substrate-binding protein [Anaerolineae bacterium]|nr:ABC transporter substrate-binding protein [Anaerolineae bacterium]